MKKYELGYCGTVIRQNLTREQAIEHARMAWVERHIPLDMRIMGTEIWYIAW